MEKATLRMAINGHELTGTKRRGKWTFQCPSWPRLAKDFKGDASIEGVVGEFTILALTSSASVCGAMMSFFSEERS